MREREGRGIRTGQVVHAVPTLVLIRDEDTINVGYAAKNPRYRAVYQGSQIETAS